MEPAIVKPTIVGVVNVTPDSFSDGGNFLATPDAADRACQLLDDGADIIEFGGESTRPSATEISVAEELDRVLPVIQEVVQRRPGVQISIDTTKAPVADAALAAGATIVNDVSALRLDSRLAEVCARAGCHLVLMHSRGGVGDMASYDHADYPNGVMHTIIAELTDAVNRAITAGVKRDAIILDPGIGFSKRSAHSISALAQLPELVKLGFPVLIGVSRKRFIGEITGVARAQDRDAGTIGANVAALTLGAQWFRVHEVRANRHALDVAAAILRDRV